MKALSLSAGILAVCFLLSSCATVQLTTGLYSEKAQKLYDELAELNTRTDWTNLNSLVSPEMKESYNIFEEDGDLWVHTKFFIDEEIYDDQELWNNGIKVGKRINEEVEAKVPLHAYLTLPNILSLEHIKLAAEVH